jgi:hypothetical protein
MGIVRGCSSAFTVEAITGCKKNPKKDTLKTSVTVITTTIESLIMAQRSIGRV